MWIEKQTMKPFGYTGVPHIRRTDIPPPPHLVSDNTLRVTKQTVTAGPRKLTARWTMQTVSELQTEWGAEDCDSAG